MGPGPRPLGPHTPKNPFIFNRQTIRSFYPPQKYPLHELSSFIFFIFPMGILVILYIRMGFRIRQTSEIQRNLPRQQQPHSGPTMPQTGQQHPPQQVCCLPFGRASHRIEHNPVKERSYLILQGCAHFYGASEHSNDNEEHLSLQGAANTSSSTTAAAASNGSFTRSTSHNERQQAHHRRPVLRMLGESIGGGGISLLVPFYRVRHQL